MDAKAAGLSVSTGVGVCFLRASRSSPLTESVGEEVDRLVGKQNVRVLAQPCHRPTGRPLANPRASLGLSVPLCTMDDLRALPTWSFQGPLYVCAGEHGLSGGKRGLGGSEPACCRACLYPHIAFCISPFRFQSVQRV